MSFQNRNEKLFGKHYRAMKFVLYRALKYITLDCIINY